MPKQPWALKRQPAVHPTANAQNFPDVLYLGTDLGDTPCLDSKGNQWDLELITAREVENIWHSYAIASSNNPALISLWVVSQRVGD